MTQTLRLPGHIDSSAAPPLVAQMLEQAGQPLTLDATDVTFIGALGAQALVSAKKQWDADGLAFSIEHVGDDMVAACNSLGVPLDAIGGVQSSTQTEEQSA